MKSKREFNTSVCTPLMNNNGFGWSCALRMASRTGEVAERRTLWALTTWPSSLTRVTSEKCPPPLKSANLLPKLLSNWSHCKLKLSLRSILYQGWLLIDFKREQPNFQVWTFFIPLLTLENWPEMAQNRELFKITIYLPSSPKCGIYSFDKGLF